MTGNKTTQPLNDLIAIARDGHEFYQEAAGKVEDQELRALFVRIAASKQRLVTELGAAVQAAGGQPEDSGTLVGSMRQFYGKIRATLGDTDYGYVAELEESEDRLLGAFRDAANDADTSLAAREVIQALMPEVRECHDVMRARKLALKQAG